ncbi:MAG TPA: polysaccharide deacetylase family protein [Planctomycetota bacterium]
MTTTLLLLLLSQDPPYTELYEQKIRVRLRDGAAAAAVDVLPLYGGAEWAISSRWDDNIYTTLKMRDVLEKHGYRGTFYLNGRDTPYYGPTYDLVDPKDAASIDRRLLAGGNTIGGHSWTHAFVPYCNRRRVFEEILRVRVDREASSDAPVASYAFSFTRKRNDLEGPASRDDIVEAVRRSGYHHVANGTFRADHDPGMSVSWLLPHDGRPIDEAFEKLLADGEKRKTDPNISFNMHVWYTTPEAWEKFEAQLEKYGRRPGWWYCNQTEYAAYRRQFRYSTLKTSRDGAALDVALRRPCLLDLGDPVPLTLAIRGDVVAVELDGVPLPVEKGRVNIPHAPSPRLPAKIGWIEGEGADPDFPRLSARLGFQDGALELSLTNGGDAPIENVRVLYRLPLEWAGGAVVRRPGTIRPGATLRDRLPLTRATTDAKYASGSAFFAAQVDFAGGRLHVTARAADPNVDPSYPRGRFLVAGPIADADFSLAGLPDVAGRAWRAVDPSKADFLDVEVVPTSLSWRYGGTEPIWYLARSTLESDVEGQVGVVIDRTSVKALFVNGERVDGAALTLRKGDNRILLASKIVDKFSPENAGAFFRLTDGSGRRLTAARYRAE